MKLYRHFNQTFWERVRDYGPDFQHDLRIFREQNSAVSHQCLVNASVKPFRGNTSGFMPSVNASPICRDMLRTDNEWVSILRGKMKKKMKDFVENI